MQKYSVLFDGENIFQTSSGVIVSAFPMTGMMLILSCSCFMNSMSRGFNPEEYNIYVDMKVIHAKASQDIADELFGKVYEGRNAPRTREIED